MITLSQKSEKISRPLLIIILGLVFFLVASFIFYQILMRTFHLIGVNRQLLTRKAVLSDKLAYLEGLNEELITKQVKELELVFPSQKAIFELLNSLQALAGQNNLALGEYTVSETEASAVWDKKSGQSFPVEFTLTGKSSDIAKFIKDMPKTPPLPRIISWGIKLDKNSLTESVITLILKCEVPWQAIPETIPAVDSPVAKITDSEKKILDSLSSFNFRTPGTITSGPVSGGKEDPFSLPL